MKTSQVISWNPVYSNLTLGERFFFPYGITQPRLGSSQTSLFSVILVSLTGSVSSPFAPLMGSGSLSAPSTLSLIPNVLPDFIHAEEKMMRSSAFNTLTGGNRAKFYIQKGGKDPNDSQGDYPTNRRILIGFRRKINTRIENPSLRLRGKLNCNRAHGMQLPFQNVLNQVFLRTNNS